MCFHNDLFKCGHVIRGGEWYSENSGSRKFLFQSRNLGGVLNESRNLVFLCFFASQIVKFLAARSRRLGFLFIEHPVAHVSLRTAF